MKNEKTVKVNYSIISRGTEKYNNHGYMGVSEIANNSQYILNIDHGILESEINDQILIFKGGYSIYNIAFTRFELITAIMYKHNKLNFDDKIVIFGLGNIGISCLVYLLDMGYQDITVVVKEEKEFFSKLKILKENYKQSNVNIQLYNNYLENNFTQNIYIDTTGSSDVLEKIFNSIKVNSTIVILSTPRNSAFKIDPLLINRENLKIYGGHELNGIDKGLRQQLFEELLRKNESKLFLESIVSIHQYSEEILNNILIHKQNFIDVLKYE